MGRIVLHDPVGVKEIAERLGIRQSAVSNWQNRYAETVPRFPAPRIDLGHKCGRIWEWSDIELWMAIRERVKR